MQNFTLGGVRVENFDSPRSGKAVANQFIIKTPQGEYFQSYQSVIAFKPACINPNAGVDGEKCPCRWHEGIVYLDARYWDYSTTTGKYRNEFLGEGIEETRKKIASGVYQLVDLNKAE